MNLTPMMQQYQAAKQACPGALLFFRMGDFYELFFEDAQIAASVLGLALTSRDKNENPVPMAGFPYHQLESYLARLIQAGHRVAICEQVEDPKQAKGIVRREVTRVVSRGTLTDDALLDPAESNFLAAVVPESPAGLAWVDISTGQFQAMELPLERLADELARIAPVECLLSEASTLPWMAESSTGTLIDKLATEKTSMAITRRAPWNFTANTALAQCSRQFGVATLEGLGFARNDAPSVRAAGAILEYLNETQKCCLDHLEHLTPYRRESSLELDEATRRSLELTRTIREGKREGSLLGVLDRTVTAMGARLLAEWLAAPLTDLAKIEARLDAVEELVADAGLETVLREELKQIHDMQRLLARVTTGRASPRDLSHLARTLARLPGIKAKLTARRSGLIQSLEDELDLCGEIRSRLEKALEADCPLSSRDGGLIRSGFHQELDKLRELATGGKQWIAQYQANEIARTGISTLKVGFNKVFGYYLEVTNPHQHKVPTEYVRRQTVKNAERYITPELKEYEEKVLTADERAKALECELFIELRDAVAAAVPRLLKTAKVLAQLDVFTGLSHLARQRGYCRPRVEAEPVLEIRDGRHPVLDDRLAAGTFVPNDTRCGTESATLLLITGPNMAGKSTYIRQVALLTLMAQLGSFVPAREARIGIADQIFARVGASDELARGQSTFMVEMTETARILNQASARSLVILDEIGRGTSTYDGISLAWAVVEYLHDRIGCRTFFATHYHELTELARSLQSVRNLNVAVSEHQDEVVFLHKIIDGAADKSYGIHVAKLAGVPRPVVARAQEILGQLEADHLNDRGDAKWARSSTNAPKGPLQLTLFAMDEHPVIDRLRGTDLDGTTPLEALLLLKEWKESLSDTAAPPQVVGRNV